MRNRRNMSYERHNCPSVIGRRKYENSWKTNFTSNYVGGGTRNSQVFHLYELTEGMFPLEQGWVLAVWMSNKWTRKLKNSYHWLQFVWLCLPLPICSCIKKNPSVNVLLQKPLFTNFQLITPQHGPCVYTGQEGESYIGEKYTDHMTERKWYLRGKLKYHILCFIGKNYIYIDIYTYKGLELAKISIVARTASTTAENRSEKWR